jgi:DNA repair exonuclease SbcCD ATPase subunit
MPSPKLMIRRIVVEGNLSFDQKFFPGLNIIHATQSGNDARSTNGCGKTSLVELIQHGFGRSQESKAKFHFATIIEQLDKLWLEFETDGGIYTIERSLKDIFSAARFHEGPYVAGMENTPAEVVKIDDMSQLLLNLTNIPVVSVGTKTGKPTPLSFRLLMRSFILHQEDSFSEILFKVEPESRKTDIIGFLTGITPLDRFPLEEEVGELKQELQSLENYVSQVTRFLIENNTPTPIEATAHVKTAKDNLELAREEQRTLQRLIIQRETSDKRGQTDSLRRNLLEIKREITELEQGFFSFQQEEERLKELLSSLRSDRQKSRHLQASTTQLSHVEFQLCPRCLQDITIEMQQRENSGRCSLCSRPLVITSDTSPKKILKTDDLDIQVQEAEEILLSVQKELEGYESQLSQLRDRETEIGRELESQISVYVSPAVDQLIAQADIISERQAELARATHLQEQALSLEKLKADLDKMRSRLSKLEDELEEASKAKRQRREDLRQSYADVLQAVDFPKFREVTLNPQSLMPNINGDLYIHQGTALKGLATVCYHLAMLNLARVKNTYFPKMLVIDSPNTGDLNEDSHTKLLNYFAKLYSSEKNEEQDWQIILTTRYLPKELKPYVRDTISNPDRMLLRKR